MLSVIWSGANNASDIFFLIAAILSATAGLVRLTTVVEDRIVGVMIAISIFLVALGLLAI